MDYSPIPGPSGLPFLGNMLDLRDDEAPLRAMERLAGTYGPIYHLLLGGKKSVVISDAAMMKEFLDEKRFMKTGNERLATPGRPRGLIVAGTKDPDWEQGHRILRPAFGPIKVDEMFEKMKDISHQLVLKWARFGPDEEILITDDFANMALDTVALCTMDYRFNSFYRDGAHPYVAAMNTVLSGAGQRATIPIVSSVMEMFGGSSGVPTKEERKQAAQYLNEVGLQIITDRRAHKERKNDFLDMLLFGKDPKTGEVMRDDLIQSQMTTFLIAGHETTSGTLSFATINLLQNPETYRKAQEEVDRVVGNQSVTLQHLSELKYVYAVLQETLRLSPTAPMISKTPHPDRADEICVLGGKYKIDQGTRVVCLFSQCMQDPKIFGEDAREFKPERMLESNPDYARIEPYWRPFSEGSRGCLGRPFALQEGMLALTLILQNFNLRLADPMYKMRIKHAVTIKPLGLYVKASLRHGLTPSELEQKLHNGTVPSSKPTNLDSKRNEQTNGEAGSPLTILYGTNTGTCLALAQRLACEASSSYGFSPEVLDMDAAVGRLSTEHPTIIITPSYEGEPPDNALQFVQNLEAMEGSCMQGVKYTVFGCGHRDWQATHHRIPKLVDSLMSEHGAERIAEMGLSDVSKGNPIADFEDWMDKTLLPELKKLSPHAGDEVAASTVEAEADVSTGERAALLHHDLQVGTVKDVKVLTAEGEQPEKRHMEVELPAGSGYECGDYLAVLPQSPEQYVRAVMAHFKLPNDATITLKSKSFAPLPLNISLSVQDILRNYFELAKPTTRRGLSLALQNTSDEDVRAQLKALIEDDQKFHKDITEAQTSLFTLLKKHPQIEMPLAPFLASLPPLSIRQYSISSSPLQDPEKCAITYSVLTDEKDAGSPFYGVASTYLASLRPGDRMQVATRRTAKQTFRLPLDAENTPLLMFAAGTGLAPFRGFIEQRAVQLEAKPDTRLAPAYLFFGCRDPQRDSLYSELMHKWEQIGAVKVFYSYSREPEKSDGCKHVADRMMKEIDTISGAWMAGARAYICGNRDFAKSVGAAGRSIVETRLQERKADGWTDDRIGSRKQEIFSSFSERAADDVFD